MRPPNEILKIEGLSKSYGTFKVIEDFHLSILSGERVSILGANGAGKTSLFNLIGGDTSSDNGRIFFMNEDITFMPPHQRVRKGLRRTYQKSSLFKDLNIFENLAIALKGVSQKRISFLRARKDKSLVDSVYEIATTMGLEKMMDTPANQLSHGVARQLEISMALIGNPHFILFDEPAAGLSPAEREELLNVFDQLPSSISCILIEHDMDIALQFAERSIVMDKGKIIAQGSSFEILKNEEVRKIYLGS